MFILNSANKNLIVIFNSKTVSFKELLPILSLFCCLYSFNILFSKIKNILMFTEKTI